MSENMKEVERPEVEQALDDQEKSIQYLNELVEQTYCTFISVIRSEQKKETEEPDEKESTVPIVEIIKRKTRSIQRINAKLKELINSCEL